MEEPNPTSGSRASQWVVARGRAKQRGGDSMKHLFSWSSWKRRGEGAPGSQVCGSDLGEAAALQTVGALAAGSVPAGSAAGGWVPPQLALRRRSGTATPGTSTGRGCSLARRAGRARAAAGTSRASEVPGQLAGYALSIGREAVFPGCSVTHGCSRGAVPRAGAIPGSRGLPGIRCCLLSAGCRGAVPGGAAGGSEGHLVTWASGDLKETLVIDPLQVLEESILFSKVVNDSDFQPFASHGTHK